MTELISPSSSRCRSASPAVALLTLLPQSNLELRPPASRRSSKFSRFLRNELLSNDLTGFGLRKGLDHLDAVRQKFQSITDRFADFQAQSLNVNVDFPVLQRLALPIPIGTVRYPGIRLQDVRVIRLVEVLLHGGTTVGGWTAKQIHQAVLTTFCLSAKAYGLNQLRYDLRSLKARAAPARRPSIRLERLTTKGVQVALLFLFCHKRICGPLPITTLKANWKLPNKRPTRPSSKSFTCLLQPDVTRQMSKYFCFMIFDLN
jgi:hypothetical protein